MDERLQFVARRLAGEAMSELCREFGISRKTGYKIFERYQECGVQWLTDRSRRPHHYAHKLPFQVENYTLNVKREHPTWGARKIRERPSQRTLVHRLQRGVLARKSSVLLSADGHPIMPAVISSPVRLFLLPEKSTLSLCLSGFLRSAAYRPTSVAITACPSLLLTRCST